MVDRKIPVGISSCLLGENVRYNGGHTQSRFCLNHLSQVFEFDSYCPEVAIGLGIPREPIRMIGPLDSPRVVGTVTVENDVTDALFEYGKKIGRNSSHLSGYILMKNSPSCGYKSTKIYNGKMGFPGKYAGMFTRGLMEENALLPVEEDGRLNDAVLRENFIARVYAYDDWKHSVGDAPSAKKLVDFHSRYKYMVMAHGQQPYKELGRLVAKAGVGDIGFIASEYVVAFMKALQKPASRSAHTNTLAHLLGYLRDEVDGKARQAIAEEIENYRLEKVNLSVPVALLKHYLNLYGSEYIKSQAYLQPHSYDLGLRNMI